ncbi:uncharacterized protein LOC120339326 [Styela clava]
MMLVRLSFYFALCALALGSYPPKKCNVKEVSKTYYDDFNHGQQDTYGGYKPRGRDCKKTNFAPAKAGYCPNLKYGFVQNDKSCPDRPCYTKVFKAISRCHGKVWLSKVYHYRAKECSSYSGKSCQNFGFNRQPHGRYKRSSGEYLGPRSVPHVSNSGSYGASSHRGSNSGGYGASSYRESNSGSYAASSHRGSNSGGYRASSYRGSNSGSYGASSHRGSNSGSYGASSHRGSNSGGYGASSHRGSNSGGYGASSHRGSNSGGYGTSSHRGSNSGGYGTSSHRGSNSGGYGASSHRGSNSGGYGTSSHRGSNSGGYGTSSHRGSNSGSYTSNRQPQRRLKRSLGDYIGSGSVPHVSNSGSYGSGYHPVGPKPRIYSICSCYTFKCTHEFEACYEHKGVYYKDTVTAQVPCGCSCYERSKQWK